MSKKTSIVFYLIPEWSVLYPPFNLARLAAVAKEEGYGVHVRDLNIEAFHQYKSNWRHNLDYNPWDASKDWKWGQPFYQQELHPHLEPILLKYLDEIEILQPTAVGFTLYYCNEAPVLWFAKEVKRRYPHIKIVVGGPQTHGSYWRPAREFDYIVSGEGEELVLEVLKELEENGYTSQRWLKNEINGKINLSALPNPYYDDIDLTNYNRPNSVASELSRGCVAKCVYCLETHYWKYRYRTAESALSEIIDLYKKGINFVHFIDSLVNGNLKELRKFAVGVVENDLKIKWTGYARADKRMDYEFFLDLAKSGCYSLNYGFESGSNKVLDDINKKNTREDIEENLKNSSLVGIKTDSNWLLGFPTETLNDFYQTLIIIYRTRNYNHLSISGGAGMGISSDMIAAHSFDHFNISYSHYQRHWISQDFTNTKIHRLVRVKTFNMLLEILNGPFKIPIEGGRRLNYFYKLNIKKILNTDVPYEDFDFDICKTTINPFADALFNEMWPFFRICWKMFGEYDIEVKYDPVLDANEFGPVITGNFTGVYKFSINAEGEWEAFFDLNFIQDENAWTYVNHYNATSQASNRARVFAIVKENQLDESKKIEETLMEHEKIKHNNFTFAHTWVGTGKWD